MRKNGEKLFIVRKYVMANSVEDALKKAAHIKADDVYVDDDWRKGTKDNLAAAIGFHAT